MTLKTIDTPTTPKHELRRIGTTATRITVVLTDSGELVTTNAPEDQTFHCTCSCGVRLEGSGGWAAAFAAFARHQTAAGVIPLPVDAWLPGGKS